MSLQKILATFYNKPWNIKKGDVIILANSTPKEIMANTDDLSKKGASDIRKSVV